MGGYKQPYMYQPVTYGHFNPKAYTQSLMTPAPPRPVQSGPLITFNKHPDRYDIAPYGKNVGVEPMGRRSKKGILWTRKLQLVLRCLQLPAAIAVLVCVITIKGAPDTEGWILRLPPAFDLATLVYAVWHLVHSAVHRPPASAASYHAFALLMDIGLIPFYAYASILTKYQLELSVDTAARWRTMFNTDLTTDLIFKITWITMAVSGGLHGVSLFISAYLIFMFRKISNMPPDMNPLEDNLTSRNKTKHKYKNSDLSSLVGEDKRFSDISARTGTTAMPDDLRMSQTSERLMGDPRASGVSFFSSRASHDTGYSPHNPETRQSWVVEDPNIYRDPDVYKQKGSARNSRVDLPSTRSMQTQDYPSSPITSSMPRPPQISKRSSVVSSPIPVYDEDGGENNWEALEPSETGSDFDPYRISPGKDIKPYTSVSQDEEDHYNPSQPLRMNPPTPDLNNPSPLTHLSQGYHYHDKENSHEDRSQTMLSNSSSIYSESAPPVTAQQHSSKSRFYTDLAAAMRGVRQHDPLPARTPKSVAGSVHTHLSSSTATMAVAGDRRVIQPSGTIVRKPRKEVGEAGFSVAKASPSRVVSRSGVDVGVMDFGAAAGDIGLGGMGRREVSGKIAEEGRGGMWRRVSGRGGGR